MAYIDDCGSYTYGELAERGERFADALRMLCVQRSSAYSCACSTAYAALLAHADLPRAELLSLRCCCSAGEALPEDVGGRWHQRGVARALSWVRS